MQTLLDMGSNQNSTIVFPIPIELIRPLLAEPVPMNGPMTAVANGPAPLPPQSGKGTATAAPSALTINPQVEKL
jgi:hypothetical protein